MSVQPVYTCEVKEVFSGDDLVAMIDLGIENLWKRQRIRLAGVDTPQAIGATGGTEAGQIRSFVRMLVRNRKASLTVVSRNVTSWVVLLTVETPEGQVNVNELLIAKGYEFKRG